MVFSMLQDKADTEDAAQEAFLKASGTWADVENLSVNESAEAIDISAAPLKSDFTAPE
ncbi:hypothetical protein ACPOL_3328 [Acidisarcina polymorpha]|uniref:Uncharacterized protein n=2 Tax=Acidisarcina polymorpha TaxID=2211140 RepID=A0A2Z5G0P8_9BACT|nr:hypothetical protein ACPOL_3328 [Acidisarcina polymorpha]